VWNTAGVTIAPATPFTLIPGMTTTVNIPANSKVLITTYGAVQTTSGAINGYSTVDVVVAIDGFLLPNGAYQRVIAANNGSLTTQFQYWSITTAPVVAAGSHTFAVFAAGAGGVGSNATVGGDTNSVLQGELSVTILKQ